ncbi:MAG TPA: phosphatase PAP2 family protein [Candidatus Kapabacteria bacterium]|nr:phosphatase PAP2 family protein [Candidatus Kapabacteria bacterium]
MIRYILFLTIVVVASQVCVVGDAFAQIPQKATSDTTSIKADSTTLAVLKQSSAGHIIWHDIKEGAYDGVQYVTRPLHWNLKEWGIVAAGVGLGLALEFADQPIQKIIEHNKNKFGDDFSMFGNNFYGDGYATGLAFLSLYTVGIATDNNQLRVMGRHVVTSFAYAGLTTTVLKILIGRNRPFVGQGAFVYHGFSLNNAFNSMPSGHVTVASALSETLAADIDKPWAYVTFYAFDAATIFGRLYSDEHWFSDTFLAAVIGTAAGYWVSQETDHYDMKTNDPKPTSFLIVPTPTGIGLAYQF